MRLSVIIPFYNRARFLRAAVQSILHEALADTEIIAVDDGSTDSGASTLAGLPVRLVGLPKNVGPAGARNAGVRVASGHYLYFFDSDDILFQGALCWAMNELESRVCDQAIGGRVGSVIDENGVERQDRHSRQYCNPQNRPSLLTKAAYLAGRGTAGGLPLYLFRKSFLNEVGPLDETLRVSEDREFLLRILSKTSIPLFDRPFIHRRVHAENLSASAAGEQWSFKKKARAMSALIDLGQ